MYGEVREMAHQAPFFSNALWRPFLLYAIRPQQQAVGNASLRRVCYVRSTR